MGDKSMGFLGPEGSYSEEVGIFIGEKELVPFTTIPQLIKSFMKGDVRRIILPIENSAEGIVTASIDNLIAESKNGFLIEREIVMTIRHYLVGLDNAKKIKTIISHPQALAQCDRFIEEIGVKTIPHQSTSGAVKIVSGKKDPTIAAIAGERVAKIYGLKVLKEHIQDSSNNATRFIILGHNKMPQTGCDKTSFIFRVEDRPGSLFNVLQVFSALDINLTQIVSRPSKKKMGEYIFYVEIDGHQDDKEVDVALKLVNKKTSFCKILGSYSKFQILK